MLSDNNGLQLRDQRPYVISQKCRLNEKQNKKILERVQCMNSGVPISVAVICKSNIHGSFDLVSILSVWYFAECVFCLIAFLLQDHSLEILTPFRGVEYFNYRFVVVWPLSDISISILCLEFSETIYCEKSWSEGAYNLPSAR